MFCKTLFLSAIAFAHCANYNHRVVSPRSSEYDEETEIEVRWENEYSDDYRPEHVTIDLIDESCEYSCRPYLIGRARAEQRSLRWRIPRDIEESGKYVVRVWSRDEEGSNHVCKSERVHIKSRKHHKKHHREEEEEEYEPVHTSWELPQYYPSFTHGAQWYGVGGGVKTNSTAYHPCQSVVYTWDYPANSTNIPPFVHVFLINSTGGYSEVSQVNTTVKQFKWEIPQNITAGNYIVGVWTTATPQSVVPGFSQALVGINSPWIAVDSDQSICKGLVKATKTDEHSTPDSIGSADSATPSLFVILAISVASLVIFF